MSLRHSAGKVPCSSVPSPRRLDRGLRKLGRQILISVLPYVLDPFTRVISLSIRTPIMWFLLNKLVLIVK